MTAVVAVLNKQAVAIAADSAVTVTVQGKRKIYNNAMKIFTLSKYHPVGVMLYNSAEFMSTPWEVIIKTYRKELREKAFPTLKEYQEDFIGFLRKKKFFADAQSQNDVLSQMMAGIINEIMQELKERNDAVFHPATGDKAKVLELFSNKLDELLTQFRANERCDDLATYSVADFKKDTSSVIPLIVAERFTRNGFTVDPVLQEKMTELFHLVTVIKEPVPPHTGLVFVGYGEEEIYPHLVPVKMCFAIGSHLKYHIDSHREHHISNSNRGSIQPFAQEDVMQTVLSGIDPDLERVFLEHLMASLDKYNGEVLNTVRPIDPTLANLIEGIDLGKLVGATIVDINKVKMQQYVSPLMRAVSSLSKEDLAEMAESLIHLTYLKRRITNAEESVGGPVDVAIISKGDGFIWMKRKHYFKPELNKQFFDNYRN